MDINSCPITTQTMAKTFDSQNLAATALGDNGIGAPPPAAIPPTPPPPPPTPPNPLSVLAVGWMVRNAASALATPGVVTAVWALACELVLGLRPWLGGLCGSDGDGGGGGTPPCPPPPMLLAPDGVWA